MKERIQFLIQIQDLCATVCEGILYLAGHSQDTSVKDNIQAGITAFKGYISSAAPAELNNSIWGELKAALSAPNVNPKRLLASGRQLSSWCSETISGILSKAVAEISCADRETAELIYHFYDCAEHSNASIYQLIFDTCLKSGTSAPEKSFAYLLKIIQEQPALLSGENMPHPGYQFQTSRQKTFERCPICGGGGTPYYSALAYRMADFTAPHLPVKLWMRCASCGNLYTWKYPEELLAGPENPGYRYPDPLLYRETVGETSASILSIWSDILNSLRTYTKGGTLLEVGVGHGELIAVAQEMGYDVDAVEIVTSMAQRTSTMLNLPVWNGDFLEYETDKTYSVIIMGDVIEHVTAPKKALERAYCLLQEDGVLWLSTPNFESAYSRIRKFEDPMWCEPYHITYFSYRGLRNLVEQCGFQVEKYHTSARYNGSMELILTKR